MTAILPRSEAEQNEFLVELYETLYRCMPEWLEEQQDIDDVVHDIATRCLARLRRGTWRHAPANVEFFARTLLWNALIDHLRKQLTRHKVHVEYLGERLSGMPEWMGADRFNDEASRMTFIQRVLNRLPGRYQRAFYMVRDDGASYEVVAEQLGVSPTTVHGYMKRAYQAFRDALAAAGHPVPAIVQVERKRRAASASYKAPFAPRYVPRRRVAGANLNLTGVSTPPT